MPGACVVFGQTLQVEFSLEVALEEGVGREAHQPLDDDVRNMSRLFLVSEPARDVQSSITLGT